MPRQKGFHHSIETREKLRLSHIGKHHTLEAKRKISLTHLGNKYCLGHHLSEEHKNKISLALQGRKYPPFTEEHKRKMSENSGRCKGDKAKQGAIHFWVRNHKSKSKLCEFCGKEKDKYGHTKLQLANLNNHIYTRNLDEWKYGHISCHRNYDYSKKCAKEYLKKCKKAKRWL